MGSSKPKNLQVEERILFGVCVWAKTLRHPAVDMQSCFFNSPSIDRVCTGKPGSRIHVRHGHAFRIFSMHRNKVR